MAKSGDWIAPDFGGHIMAHLAWKGSVAPIWSLIGLADRKLTGLLDLDLKVEGSINKPIPVVKMYLVNGSYEDLVTGIFLSGINLELTDSADQQLKLLLEAADHHDGSLALEGVIKPFDPTPNISLRGQFKNLSPLQRDDASITLTALVSLEGPLTSPAITAQAVVNNAEINLDNAKGSRSIRTLPVEDTAQVAASGPPLKVTIDMPRQIFIRGRGLDSEWSGHLSITGQTGQPLISGSLKPIRGTFDLLSKQFTLSGGDITFINSKSLNPILNLELTRQTPELTALVQVTGTVSRPHLLLQSQPPHPSDEVLSQVLFGKKVSSLSRVEALQLANSLRVMAGLGGDIGLTVLNSLRDTLGLSVLRVSDTSGGNSSRYLSGNSFRDNFNLDGSDSANTQDSATIEAGKYLSENVYVGVEQNLADNSTGVRVEVELTPSITLRGLSTSNSSRVGLGWKKDY
jgi:translocation and assembly module TamB